MEQSPAAQSAAHLGAAVHHEVLQVAESHLSTVHRTRTRRGLGTRQTTEEGGGGGHTLSLSVTNILISHLDVYLAVASLLRRCGDVGKLLLIAGCGPPYPTRPYASSTTDLAIATVFICLNDQLEESPASNGISLSDQIRS